MVHPGSSSRSSNNFTPRQQKRGSLIPPRGFKSVLYPLFHRFKYTVGLSAVTATENSTMCTIVRGSQDSAMIDPDAIEVNPINPNFAQETGVMCHQMSLIEKVKLSISFTLTEDALADGIDSLTVKYMPIFCAFAEKLASVDKVTSATAASVLELLSDATNEDVTPLYGGASTPVSAGASLGSHPVSTVNDTEVFGDLNLTSNLLMESVAWNNEQFFDSVKFFSNKGAIRSMVGQQRSVYLTRQRPTVRVFMNKFVPRAVRRIVPHSAFFMLFHVPLDSETDQVFYSGALTTAKAHVGIKMNVSYHEWNSDHRQETLN